MHPSQLPAIGSWNSQELAEMTSLSADIWHVRLVDVTAGRQVLVFEAEEAVSGNDVYAFIALDDVELLEGTCASVGKETHASNTLHDTVWFGIFDIINFVFFLSI